MPFELLQITAQYSNAVLVAILPFVSDFAKNLDLPIPTPITVSQVSSFKCDPRSGQTGGALTFTNGSHFAFLDGRVSLYRSPHSYFSLQDPELIPKFYGPVKVTKAQALDVALGVIKKLGYERRMFNADSPPLVTLPEKIGTSYIARYRFRWLDTNWPSQGRPTSVVPALLDIEVNASDGEVELFRENSRDTRRPSPKVGGFPVSTNSKPSQPNLVGGTETSPVSGAYATAFLDAILPQISDFIHKVGLNISTPVTTNQVITTNYICRILDGQPMAQLYLTNGDRFTFRQGYVASFYAHDAFWNFPEMGNAEKFLGHINVTTNEAVSLCERTLRKLGYSGSLSPPRTYRALVRGSQVVSRYDFKWRHSDAAPEFASFEVDMETKAIKKVFLCDPVFQREPPRIDVPPTPGTNAPAALTK